MYCIELKCTGMYSIVSVNHNIVQSTGLHGTLRLEMNDWLIDWCKSRDCKLCIMGCLKIKVEEKIRYDMTRAYCNTYCNILGILFTAAFSHFYTCYAFVWVLFFASAKAAILYLLHIDILAILISDVFLLNIFLTMKSYENDWK